MPDQQPDTALDGVRKKVFDDRYALRDAQGQQIEHSPHETWARVARAIAATESTEASQQEWERKFYDLLAGFKFVPGGRILSGAGSGHDISFYNCLRGDTLVHTRDGIVPIGTLDGEVEVLSQGGVYRRARFSCYGVQQLYEVVLENGTTIHATPDHQWVVGGLRRIATRDMQGQRIPVNPRPKPPCNDEFRRGVQHGILYGDGSITAAGYDWAHVPLFGEKQDLASYFEGDFPVRAVAATTATAEYTRVTKLHADLKVEAPSLGAPPSYWRGFVAGLIATDGNVCSRGTVRIFSANADLLHYIAQGMAVAGFVPASIKMTRELSPYTGKRSPVYALAIYRCSVQEHDILKPSHRAHWAAAPKPQPAVIRVASVRPTERMEPVYCCVEPETHTLTIEHGYLTGNCFVVAVGQSSQRGGTTDPSLEGLEARRVFFGALGEMTDIMSRSGGVGMNLSTLPPKGTRIGVPTRGIVARPRITVALSVEHPDLLAFVNEKDSDLLANVDVAVILSPAFREAVAQDAPWTFTWHSEDEGGPGSVAGVTLPARAVLRRLEHAEGRHIDLIGPPSSCFRVGDSREAIIAAAHDTAAERYAGQSVLVDFSALRPQGTYIKSVNGTSSGPVSWMYLFDAVARLDDGVSPTEKGTIHFMEIASTITGKTIQQGGCVGGRVRIATDRGTIPAAELADLLDAGEQIQAHTHQGLRPITAVFRNGSQKLFDVVTGAGDHVQVTASHQMAVPAPGTPDGLRLVPLRNLGDGAEVCLFDHKTGRLLSETITHVEPLGLAPTYDFEVQDVHLLSANGFYTSNSRRGALMVHINDDHPDVMDFIAAKRIDPDTGKPVMIEHANMSVCISDAFMQAVKDDASWDLHWAGQTVRTIRARDIWDAICERAHATAEPGVVFMQRCQDWANTYYYERIQATNPCGEQPLPAGGVCNLGALNLACYVDSKGCLLEEDLARDTGYALRFLDDVIDATPYFSAHNREMQQEGTRRTGLGTMGLADALIKMKVRYGSPESLEIIERTYQIIRDNAYCASVALAREKGSFPRFEAEQYLRGHFIKGLPENIKQAIARFGIRNGVLLTQAPTGTTSLLAGVSSGIEPVFAFETQRSDRLGEHLILHDLYQAWREAHPGAPRPAYFAETKDLTPEDHVRVQATIQRLTDASISKTTNSPAHHTIDDVRHLYMLAYDLGLKGVTYYREGSRDAVLTAVKETSSVAEVSPVLGAPVADATQDVTYWRQRCLEAEQVAHERAAALAALSWAQGLAPHVAAAHLKARPDEVAGVTTSTRVPEGSLHLTVNHDAEGPLEVFVNLGRAGSDLAALAEAIGRLISFVLRLPSTMSPQERLRHVALQLQGIGGSTAMGFGPNRTLSMADGLGRLLLSYLERHAAATPSVAVAPLLLPAVSVPQPLPVASLATVVMGEVAPSSNGHGQARPTGNLCPQCGSIGSYVFEEGCKKCYACGLSSC